MKYTLLRSFWALAQCLSFVLSAQTQPLRLLGHSPRSHAVEVAPLSTIQLYFNKPVPDTSQWRQIRITGNLNGRYDFAAAWQVDARVLDLLPAQPYALRERINVILPRSFFASQGDTSVGGYEFSFNAASSMNAVVFQRQATLLLDSLAIPIMLMPHDLNRDHWLDFAIGNDSPLNPLQAVPIGIFLATGNLARFDAFFKPAGLSPCCLLMTPLNEDCWSDLAVLEAIGDSLHIFDTSSGTIVQKRSYPTPDRSIWLQASDCDLDGDIDLASGSLSKGVQIFINDSAGNFGNVYPIGTGLASRAGNAADMDNDGDPDLVIGEFQPPNRDLLKVYLNDGFGKFFESDSITIGYSILIYLVDLNRDGFLDVLSVAVYASSIEIFLNDQFGGLLPLTQIRVPGSSFAIPTFIDFGDFNHDGWLDFACAISGTGSHPDSNVVIYTNQEGKNFVQTGALIVGKEPKGLTIVDLNNDQLLDLAVVSSQDRKLHIFLGERATSVEEDHGELPATWELGRAYPNPFSQTTNVVLSNIKSPARLEIFDAQGRRVLSRKLIPGFNATAEYRWDGRDQRGNFVANGLYLIKAHNERKTVTVKVVFMR